MLLRCRWQAARQEATTVYADRMSRVEEDLRTVTDITVLVMAVLAQLLYILWTGVSLSALIYVDDF